MRIDILGSGSSGNASVVDAVGTRILVDAGLSLACVQRRRALLASEGAIDAVLLSHAHGDHVEHAATIARALSIPIYMTESTRRVLRLPGEIRTVVVGAREPFRVGEILVHPVPVPHDAAQVGLVFSDGERRAAIVTDLGEPTDALIQHLRGCHTVLLESNHDPDMLDSGPYPAFLKKRIRSARGHLSNAQCAEILRTLDASVEEVVLMHLSTRNNTPAIALDHAADALFGRGIRLRAAHAEEPMQIHARPELKKASHTPPTRTATPSHAQLSLDF